MEWIRYFVSLTAFGQLPTLVRELEASLECTSCGFTLREPFLSTKCMHVACQQCFINMVCPVCQRENSECELIPEIRLRESLSTCRQLQYALEASEKLTEGAGGPLRSTTHPENANCNGVSSRDCENDHMDGDISVSKIPLKKQINSSSNSKMNKKNRLGETPLHVACKKGNLERVKELLTQGATPNTQDNAGWSPLHEVAQTGNIDIARLLIENGAQVDVASECKTLPIHDAVQAGHPEVIRLLLEYGANPEQKNGEGQSALDLAGYNDIIKGVVVDFMANPQRKAIPVVKERGEPGRPSPPAGPPVIMSSSLKGSDVQAFTKCASQIGGEIVSRFDPRVTHLVVATDETGNTQRTLKFLQCVAAGCWIVSAAWAHKCLAMGRRVDETPFEVRGCRQFAGNEAPRNSRENRASGSSGLLSGFSIYFAPLDSPMVPSIEELTTMCELAGATILKREPKTQTGNPVSSPHVKPGSLLASHSSFIVGAPSAVVKAGILWLSRDWVIDSISHFELQDIFI
ncbi:BRCA1-associated RING domain protein 1-like isoform X1 [Varroa jacobsoni]|uniref:BRCA1-associated RING domain protein 1-like isoform X1 n=1 Tax=Varroa jacobsoni TaxID=62625 RepID=UPI000BF5A926|nr:BRCA1-associated RING domain protein 1-like isoform X1 [Varroa jacobsoni]